MTNHLRIRRKLKAIKRLHPFVHVEAGRSWFRWHNRKVMWSTVPRESRDWFMSGVGDPADWNLEAGQ